MLKTIYVPQGRAARLDKESLHSANQLFTDDFNSCSIIAVIGLARLSLIHADLQVSPFSIKEEVDWVGDDSKIFLFFREPESNSTVRLLLPALQKDPRTKKIVKIPIEDKFSGVLISFESNPSNSIHPNITLVERGTNQKNILHHPDEMRFVTIQKLQQLFGLRERLETRTVKLKQICIFDSVLWLSIPRVEFELDLTHRLTLDELHRFNLNENFFQILTKLLKLIREIAKSTAIMGTIDDLAKEIAITLEFYLSGFDAKKALINNLCQLKVKNPQNLKEYILPETPNDIEFFNIFYKETNKEVIDLDIIATIVTIYHEQSASSKFKQYFLLWYNFFMKIYQERILYLQIQNSHEQNIASAKNIGQRSIQHFQKSEFAAANNLAQESLVLLQDSTTNENVDLATAYYNVGRCLQKLEQFDNAKKYLTVTLELRLENLSMNDAATVKVQRALAECVIAISKRVEHKYRSHQM